MGIWCFLFHNKSIDRCIEYGFVYTDCHKCKRSWIHILHGSGNEIEYKERRL